MTYVSSLPDREHMGLRIIKDDKRTKEIVAEVDRQFLDKATGEVRLEKREVVIPREHWRYWLEVYKEKK